MADFPCHNLPSWKFTREESDEHRERRCATESRRINVERGRHPGDLWWDAQRYVDQVVPAECVHPNNLDTFTYRYQLYARHPPIQHPPSTLAEITDEKPPVRYNVKRIAIDKPYGPRAWHCYAHFCSKPWVVEKPRTKTGRTVDCSKNNNTRSIRQESQCGQLDVIKNGQSDTQWPLRTFPAINNTPVTQSPAKAEFRTNCHDRSGNNDARNGYSCPTGNSKPNNMLGGGVNDKLTLRLPPANGAVGNGKGDLSSSLSCCSVRSESSRCPGDSRALVNLNNNRLTSASGVCHNELNNQNPRQDVGGPQNKANLESKVSTNSVQCDGSKWAESRISSNSVSVAPCKRRISSASGNRKRISVDTVASLLNGCNINVNNGNEDAKEDAYVVEMDILLNMDNDKPMIIDEFNESSTIFMSYSLAIMYPCLDRPHLGSVINECLCTNNNASAGKPNEGQQNYRLQCIKGTDLSWICNPSKNYPTMPQDRAMSCVKCTKEVLYEPQHLRCQVVPKKCGFKPKLETEDGRPTVVCEPVSPPKSPTPGYETYKIIGGLQKVRRPEIDPRTTMKLPKHLQEYQEFTRRCPDFRIGRYDRSDCLTEPLMPSHRDERLQKGRLTPYVYTRNVYRDMILPRTEPKEVIEDLTWQLPEGYTESSDIVGVQAT